MAESPWRVRTGRYPSCPFEMDNPAPEPTHAPDCSTTFTSAITGESTGDACDCGYYDEDHDDWTPTIWCDRDVAVRVILSDGRALDCCTPEAHGVGEVVWWALLVCHPRFVSDFDQTLMYFYRTDDIVELAERTHPLFELMRTR